MGQFISRWLTQSHQVAVALQQQLLGPQGAALYQQHTVSISASFISSTNTFQYFSLQKPTSFPSHSLAVGGSESSPQVNHHSNLVDQHTVDEAPGIQDNVPPVCHQASDSPKPSSLTTWPLALQQTASAFLRLGRATTYRFKLRQPEDLLPLSQDDVFRNGNVDAADESWQYARLEENVTPDTFKGDERTLSQIPQYVLDYAPLVHLYSGEEYWPCDMREHLHHISPKLNFTPIQASSQHLRLDNLDDLNQWEYGRHIFLTSNDNVEDHPDWLMGEKNIPRAPAPSKEPVWDASSSSHSVRQKLKGGRSDAPAVLVTVDKGHGVVDAFWFFFYSFNLGNVVVLRFGNHVGDWEHTVVRFHHGKPKAVFVSEHFFGQAYSYEAVEKIGKRPVVYSAIGTHAMYATPGRHAYILPWALLHDQTDEGPLWDPALNSHMYTYDLRNDTLRSSNFTPDAPTEWFHFAGRWGDKQYPLHDSRQYVFAGNYHYVSGPLGPKFKNLGRRKICQGRESDRCDIKHWLGGSKTRRVRRPFEQEEIWEEERERFLARNYRDN